MRRAFRTGVAIVTQAGDPTAGDGIALTASQRGKGGIITVLLAGATSTELQLWGKIGTQWGLLADAIGSVSALIGGAALPSGKTYHFEVTNLDGIDRIAIKKQNDAGGAVAATIDIKLAYGVG